MEEFFTSCTTKEEKDGLFLTLIASNSYAVTFFSYFHELPNFSLSEFTFLFKLGESSVSFYIRPQILIQVLTDLCFNHIDKSSFLLKFFSLGS